MTKQTCCEATFLHVHCERCNRQSIDAWLCIKCFYAEVEQPMVKQTCISCLNNLQKSSIEGKIICKNRECPKYGVMMNI